MAPPHEHVDIFRHFLHIMPRWWSRRRGMLGPPHVVLSLISMSVLGCQGYERTLAEMKVRLGKELGWIREDDVPSASALSQARAKLTPAMCVDVVAKVYDLCATARRCASVGYGGFRLLAVDGTKLALPAYATLLSHFGSPSQGAGRELPGPQASLTVLWDVGANQPVQWRLGPYKVSERVHADELVASVGAGDLLLADRGFPSRAMLCRLIRQRAQFMVRMRTMGCAVMPEVLAFLASGAAEVVTTMRGWDGKAVDPQTCHPIRLIRTDGADGIPSVYMTTLVDQQQHSGQGLLALYTQRWRIETAFREMKLWHGLERFHSRRVEGIAQEVAAIMIFQLLASELEAKARLAMKKLLPTTSAQEGAGLTTPTVRFNRRIVADCVCDILYAAACGKDLRASFDGAMFRIWRYRQNVRPGRSFPRLRKSAPRGWKPRGTKGKGRP